MSKIKIWTGFFKGNEEEYLQYFEEDDDCGFCKDIHEEEYDPDFIGIIPLFNERLDIEKLATYTPLCIKSRKLLVDDCRSLGIKEGNAILFYSGDTREIKQGEVFNQLIYINEYIP